jgi:ABC-type phosphate/phosphonate transport system substrate-binding protein
MEHEMAGWSRRGFCGAAAASLAALALGRLSARGEEAAKPPRAVKIGLIESLFREIPAPLVLFALRPFQAYMQAQMGSAGELAEGGSALELGKALTEKKVQLGVFHGLEFAWAKQRFPKLEPLFIAVNEVPILRAELLVRAADDFRSINDLEKKTLRLPNRGREHCWVFLERRCVKPGVAPREFYKIRKSGDADEVLDTLADDKKTHAALVDGIDWDNYKKANPAKAGLLKPLMTSEPLPCALIATHQGDLPAVMLNRFRNGMLGAHRTAEGQKILKLMRITHFEDIPKDFGDQLTSAAKAYPLPVKG